MYSECEESLDPLLDPGLGEREDPLGEVCIVAEGRCLVKNLSIRAGNAGLPIHTPESVVETKESRGLVIIF